MKFSTVIVLFVIALVVVILWLIYELRADERDQVRPTVPGPRDRFPPWDGA